MIINKLGLGAEFLGSIIHPDGRKGLVFSYISGVVLKQEFQKELQRLPLSRKTGDQILETADLLEEAGILSVRDFQFLISQKGEAILIDTEFFDWQGEKTDTPKRLAWKLVNFLDEIREKQKDYSWIQDSLSNRADSSPFYSPDELIKEMKLKRSNTHRRPRGR